MKEVCCKILESLYIFKEKSTTLTAGHIILIRKKLVLKVTYTCHHFSPSILDGF